MGRSIYIFTFWVERLNYCFFFSNNCSLSLYDIINTYYSILKGQAACSIDREIDNLHPFQFVSARLLLLEVMLAYPYLFLFNLYNESIHSSVCDAIWIFSPSRSLSSSYKNHNFYLFHPNNASCLYFLDCIVIIFLLFMAQANCNTFRFQ